MTNQPQLFMVLLGAKPKGRHTEQHDIFFGIANNLKELLPQMLAFWPETEGKMHIDAYRIVQKVGKYKVQVVENINQVQTAKQALYFLNLGGYKEGEFEELHYKMLIVADEKAKAINEAKLTAFYKHTGFKGAVSHIDDKYGVDVDDLFDIEDILAESTKAKYKLVFTNSDKLDEDEINLGYLPIAKI
jgi:hypothetical protein